MVIGNARVFLDGEFVPGSVSFENGEITGVSEPNLPCDIDARGKYLVPGFIDIHTHGAMGADASDGDRAGLEKMSLYYAKHGVTSFLPTTMTLKEPELKNAVYAIRDFSRPYNGAKIAGIHLEGPFLSYGKRGAQNPHNLHAPDLDMLRRLNDESGGLVRIVTVAPEMDEQFEFIKEASRLCTVSLGHTEATYETAVEAYSAGAKGATHLFNAMMPFMSREPGLIGAAIDSGAYVELICDGVHIHDSVIRAAHRLFGERLVIVSDSLSCAGMPDGDYELGGLPIVMKNGRATLLDGTIAGSSSNLHEELKVVVNCGLPLEAAIRALTLAPARAAGLEDAIGSIAPGKSADFLLLDDELEICSTFINGCAV